MRIELHRLGERV